MHANGNAGEADRDHIILLGKELEFASGIRALAAEKVMREREISDTAELFDACEELIGSANLFESYNAPLNTQPSDLVLGQGYPFPSLDAYIALRKRYGKPWVANALIRYIRRFGTRNRLGTKDPEQVVKKLVMRAHICFEYDMVWWTLPTRTPDGFGRYERAKRIDALNGYLADNTFKPSV